MLRVLIQKECRKDGKKSNPLPAKENDTSKVKIGTINRTKSTKYTTSDTVITNRSGHRGNSL